MLLSDALEKYFRHLRNIQSASKYTIRNYEKSLNLLQELCGDKAEVKDITLQTIDQINDHVFELKTRDGSPISQRRETAGL